jgi:uncharacterized protein YutE (UPF0331/DUF86 family)
MDQVIVAQKLESLRRCIQRVEDKTPASVDQLLQDPDIQDILVLNLTRAVQLCVDIGSHVISETDQPAPATMGDVFTALENLGTITAATSLSMKKSVGFRNVAVHNYDVINWNIVFSICQKSLADFRRFARKISKHTQTGNN